MRVEVARAETERVRHKMHFVDMEFIRQAEPIAGNTQGKGDCKKQNENCIGPEPGDDFFLHDGKAAKPPQPHNRIARALMSTKAKHI